MAHERHKYEYRVHSNTAAAKIVGMVGSGKRILELGPGPGAITRLLHENGGRVTALEVDQSAIDIVSQYCDRVVSCDLNSPNWPSVLEGSDGFEVIVAGDVLEHLYDPWETLRKLPPLLSDGGCLVISLPHLGHNGVISCLLSGNFDYQPWGLLDRTHIRFFCVNSIQKLFEDSDLKIVDADFVVKSPEQTEFAKTWRKLTDEMRALLSDAPFGTIYQVVVKAVPRDAPGSALQLAELAVPQAPATSWRSRFRSYLLSFLSLETRSRLSRIYGRLFLWR
jgi:2-polyprenyl-3-methyl-5-hydroxy-6-metoxy-1,4-benzoquinol methylase